MNDAWRYCGAKNLQGPPESACVRRQGHNLSPHQDLSGREWQDPPAVATTAAQLGELAMVLRDWDRKQERIAELQKQMGEFEAELQGLVKYFESRTEYKGRDNEIGADTAYGDAAERLARILDGGE